MNEVEKAQHLEFLLKDPEHKKLIEMGMQFENNEEAPSTYKSSDLRLNLPDSHFREVVLWYQAQYGKDNVAFHDSQGQPLKAYTTIAEFREVAEHAAIYVKGNKKQEIKWNNWFNNTNGIRDNEVKKLISDYNT